jgi:chaperonin GroEL
LRPKRAAGKQKDRRTEYQKIVFAPHALSALVAGFDAVASLLALTLGSARGSILASREDGSVEVLSDAGTVARRIVEIPDRCRNTGAMIMRNLAWQMHEQYGAGAATAAVLASAIVRQGMMRIEAGIDPVLIRGGLEHALSVAIAELDAQAAPAGSGKELSAVATSMTGDPELGVVLGEIVDILGPAAAITIQEYPVPYLDREYVEGAYWRAHPATRSMIPEGQHEVVLDNSRILLVDQGINGVEDILRALELATCSDGKSSLLIVAPKVSDKVLQAIALNQSRGRVSATVAVLNSLGLALTTDLTDMAILTGGCVLADIKGTRPRFAKMEHLGSALRAVISRDSLTIVGGGGDSTAIGECRAEIERQLSNALLTGKNREDLQKRLARFHGGIAILKIGAHNKAELANRRAEAEKAFRALTGMIESGVVPGGGVAFLNCRQAVCSTRATCSIRGQEHGVDVLANALSEPFLQLVRNHGSVPPMLALADAERRGCGVGFDVRTGEIVNMCEQGVIDSVRVVKGALQTAVSGAIGLLTTNVVILPAESKREQRLKP